MALLSSSRADEFLIEHRAEFQAALLEWFKKSQRPLPWRRQPSVYKTVVSEFMLQQTQVKTVLPFFARWLEIFPDFASLAASSEEKVLKNWEGLGYYSRARNLHRLAKAVSAADLPRHPSDWRNLPGVGPYTAAAITSISFGEPVACVDGNVVRILSRLTADSTPFRDSATAAKALAPLAQEIVSREKPGDFNQAMMELGATVCQRRNPSCAVCPVRSFCAGTRTGSPEQFPQLAARVVENIAVTRIWWVRDGQLLLHRASASAKRLAHLHELPRAIDAGFEEQTLSARTTKVLAIKKRTITRYSITETIHDVSGRQIHESILKGIESVRNEAVAESPPLVQTSSGKLVWIALDQLETITLSGPHRRWINELIGLRPLP